MHSENVNDCEISVKLIGNTLKYAEQQSYPEVAKQLRGLHKSAEQMLTILRAFGRFPHRNDALGRPSTDRERTYFDTGILPEIKPALATSF